MNVCYLREEVLRCVAFVGWFVRSSTSGRWLEVVQAHRHFRPPARSLVYKTTTSSSTANSRLQHKTDRHGVITIGVGDGEIGGTCPPPPKIQENIFEAIIM